MGDLSKSNLALQRAQFSVTPPWTDFARIIDYLDDEHISYGLFLTKDAPIGSLYLINICWFDHAVDYLALISTDALRRLRAGEIRLVFLYFEADPAHQIQRSLFHQCELHDVNPWNVHVILGNTSADMIYNFHYFDDDEVIYARSQRSYASGPLPWHDAPRSKVMTMLTRVHKSWRAYFCSWYWHQGLDKRSFFSYRLIDQGEDMDPDQCPLNHTIKYDDNCQSVMKDFLAQAPFAADDLEDHQHNFYGTLVSDHYRDAYWHCVLETHLCLSDDMPGVFISEKTWKPIAHAQPFVILGCAGTLRHLRSLGYKTFHALGLDESYDSILDPTLRFRAVQRLVQQIHGWNADRLHDFNMRARAVLEHNQTLYWTSAKSRIETLLRRLVARV